MENEVLMFKVHDPEFSVRSEEDYVTLMQWLARTTLELAEEYPDNPILVCYLVAVDEL